MALPTSRLAYEDVFKILDRALDTPRGIRMKMADEGAAKKMRSRIHYARKLDRDDNRQNFSHDHPMYGRSIYDPITLEFRYEGRYVWIYLTNQGSAEYIIEEIPDEQQAPNGNHGEVEGEGEGEGGGEETPPQAEPQSLRPTTGVRRI